MSNETTDYTPEHAAPVAERPLVSNETYDGLKRTAQLVLPALGALYYALATIWGLPRADEIVGSIAAVNAFVGVLVTVLGHKYNNSEVKYDGTMKVHTTDEGLVQANMVLKNYEDPAAVTRQKEVLFKVEDV